MSDQPKGRQGKRKTPGFTPDAITLSHDDEAALDDAWAEVSDEEMAASIEWTEQMDKDAKHRPTPPVAPTEEE